MAKKKKMREVPAGQFKAKCLKLMDEVQRTREAIVITKHGIPVVTILPFEEDRHFPYGCMKGTINVKGDIVSSTGEDWNAKIDY